MNIRFYGYDVDGSISDVIEYHWYRIDGWYWVPSFLSRYRASWSVALVARD